MITEAGVAETARKALEILDRDGWCRWSLECSEADLPYYRRQGMTPRAGSHDLCGLWSLAVLGRLQPDAGAEDVYGPLARRIRELDPDLDRLFTGGALDVPVFYVIATNDRWTTESEARAFLEGLAAG